MTIKILLAGSFSALLLASPALAEPAFQVREDRIVDTVLTDGLSAAKGQWRSRIQVIFDPKTQQLERRAYELFDLNADQNLTFTWQADDLSADKPGKITGTGRLVWREADKPAYDDTGIVNAYRGTLRNGRAEGQGLYATRDGLSYDGQWKAGRPHGRGRLVLPNGEEYEGEFRDGFAEGAGRYTETTWERFEGTFKRGLRSGTGKTTLPSGLAYESHWAAGRETPNSYQVRVAQVGAAPAVGEIDDIKFGITMEKKPKSVDPKAVVLYSAKMVGSDIVVEPNDQRLVSVWLRGGEIKARPFEEIELDIRNGMFTFEEGYIQPAKFNITLQNRSTQPAEIKSATIDVLKSEAEHHPALELTPGTDLIEKGNCSYTTYMPNFGLANYGWSAVEPGQMKLGFQAVGANERPATLPHTLRIGGFNQNLEINVEKLLEAEGVKTVVIRAIKGVFSLCSPENTNACLERLRREGTYGNLGKFIAIRESAIEVQVRGTYTYAWTDAKNEKRTSTSPIMSTLVIGRLPTQAECGAGGPETPVREKPVMLRANGDNYKVSLPFRRSISGGRSASFSIPVESEKSSNHQFRVRLQLADGREVTSPLIKLLYFKPRSKKTN